jgi:hypothetical protein
MHATMPIFNAWCDRTPMIILAPTAGGRAPAPAVDRLDSLSKRSSVDDP